MFGIIWNRLPLRVGEPSCNLLNDNELWLQGRGVVEAPTASTFRNSQKTMPFKQSALSRNSTESALCPLRLPRLRLPVKRAAGLKAGGARSRRELQNRFICRFVAQAIFRLNSESQGIAGNQYYGSATRRPEHRQSAKSGGAGRVRRLPSSQALPQLSRFRNTAGLNRNRVLESAMGERDSASSPAAGRPSNMNRMNPDESRHGGEEGDHPRGVRPWRT
jgi:hypothetical protein